MTAYTNTFDAPEYNGQPITVADSGGGNGRPFDEVATDGGGLYFQDDSGVLCAFVIMGGDPANNVQMRWYLPSTERCGGSLNLFLYEIPDDVNGSYFYLLQFKLNEADIFVQVDSQRRLYVNTTRGFGQFTAINTVPVGQWFRLTWNIVATGTRTAEFRIYNTPADTEPAAVLSGSNPVDYDMTFADVAFGQPFDSYLPMPGQYLLDSIEANDTGFPAMEEPADPSDGVEAPPANAEVSAPSVVLPAEAEQWPPAVAEVYTPTVRLIDASCALLSPADELHIPSRRPVFTVDVTSKEFNARVEVQYSDDPAFASYETLTATFMPGAVVTHAKVSPTDALDDNTEYFWRARVANAFDHTEWTAPWSFTVSTGDGDAILAGTWNVAATAIPYPHLWFFLPSRAAVGDTAVAYGTGFPIDARVIIADVTASGTLVETIAPADEAYTADRVIDAATGRCDPGHQIATFVVPEVEAPGGLSYVEGD